MQLTENQIEKIIEILKSSKITSYKISKKTGITQATIGNYRTGKTKPTQSNALILMQYFNVKFADDCDKNYQNNGININGNHNTTGDIDNRQYYSDSPDVLRKEIDILDEWIKEKDAQIKEKDAQINKLLNIISCIKSADLQ